MGINMLYCPPNITLSEVWVNNGTSQCFMETVSSSITFGFIVLFGSVQLGMYRKYGIEVSSNHLPKSKLYALQILVALLVPLLAVTRFVLQATFFNDHEIYIYMIVTLVMTVIMFPYSIVIFHTERKYLLPSVPTRGHGLVLLIFWTLVFVSVNLDFINIGQKLWWFQMKTLQDQVEMTLFVLQYVSCLVMFVLGLRAPGIMQNVDYFSLNDSTTGAPGSGAADQGGSTFRNTWQKVRTLAPFLWPRDVLLQARVLFCFGLLLSGRVVNLYVPLYSKYIVDSMTDTPLRFRWDWVATYVGLKFLQGGGTGGMGVLNNLRSFLWLRVQQHSTREVQVELFRHLHSLSLRWHLARRSGEVLRVMDRGTESVNNLLSNVLFSIAPTLVDICVAVVFFVSAFDAWFGLIVLATMALYLACTVLVTEWRTKFQRRMNLADNATTARSVDSLLNFETVKYCGAERFEVDAYRAAVLHFQGEQWLSLASLNLLNTVQNVLISGGLLAGSLLCVHRVVAGLGLTVGDYVLFASYIVQLYVPLNWFGTYYRTIQRNFIDMENMFDLLRQEQEVLDAPGAGPLLCKRGAIDFLDVSFGYEPERRVLRNVSFSVPAGKTVALVGPSGSGKSTVLRLLFRFYDVDAGAVLLDGQNVKTVTQESLRRAIGVVPQDTVLFNDTVRYNIRYGRTDADDAEVQDAAVAADIHERVLSFPDGYDTQVGERGLRLSGGEKQRVAIARLLLKAPAVVLLDEATSALDTRTERVIQAALDRALHKKTTLVVAHRLSTVVHADEILVLHDGEVVERGNHDYLVAYGGLYTRMWRDQLKEEQDAPPPADLERSADEPADHR